jgi:hypothetical protein
LTIETLVPVAMRQRRRPTSSGDWSALTGKLCWSDAEHVSRAYPASDAYVQPAKRETA